jgi:hypothetical protein
VIAAILLYNTLLPIFASNHAPTPRYSLAAFSGAGSVHDTRTLDPGIIPLPTLTMPFDLS